MYRTPNNVTLGSKKGCCALSVEFKGGHKKWYKFVIFHNRGGGLKFLLKFSKTIFALELSTNLMKHTIHEFGRQYLLFS